MASFQQIPAELPITCIVGDELNVGLSLKTAANAAVNVTGYTLEAKVYVPTYANPDGSFGSGAYTVGSTAATFTTSVVSASAGTVNIGLTEQQTAALSPAVGYRWFFRWVDTSGVTLTVLAGAFTARAP